MKDRFFIDVTVPAPCIENFFRLLLAAFCFHSRDVFSKHRIMQRRDQLGVVMIITQETVAVWIGPDPDIGLPKTVRRAVLPHLSDRDLARTIGMALVRL